MTQSPVAQGSTTMPVSRAKRIGLCDFLPPFPGFFLYFPQRRNMVPKLRALIDHVRQWQAPPSGVGG
ncbi:hypothetical protein [Burkholderia lata]|uniref:hypothetical protein n=1 Tax=Burkholderia lata (strain ATCC 17760 / DSM 23089 / LMG 22485 / NCIMB 9086 / R18194 / 383) TaxID=482957 RepID=UPI001C2E99CC|nr:hypothetical protein [Burkholderia lata]